MGYVSAPKVARHPRYDHRKRTPLRNGNKCPHVLCRRFKFRVLSLIKFSTCKQYVVKSGGRGDFGDMVQEHERRKGSPSINALHYVPKVPMSPTQLAVAWRVFLD